MTQGRRLRKQKPEIRQEINLVELIERFHSEDACRAYLEDLRWPDGMACMSPMLWKAKNWKWFLAEKRRLKELSRKW